MHACMHARCSEATINQLNEASMDSSTLNFKLCIESYRALTKKNNRTKKVWITKFAQWEDFCMPKARWDLYSLIQKISTRALEKGTCNALTDVPSIMFV